MKAEKSSWKIEPFEPEEKLDYSRRFSASEYERLQQGLIPAAMEDKWFVYFADGSLFLHRSWTGQGVYRVDLAEKDDGAIVEDAYRSDAETGSPAYSADLLDFLIGNLLLGESKPFPLPPNTHESAAGVYQHGMTGTGYPERTFNGDDED
ncbi:hypothetical protein [Fulvimarina sp. MAC8]|uniref:hypothetical protein n=1 Tax=Fulvimarina sp. MAC8 TaxID=3162874 RepID=UPI0032ED5ED4